MCVCHMFNKVLTYLLTLTTIRSSSGIVRCVALCYWFLAANTSNPISKRVGGFSRVISAITIVVPRRIVIIKTVTYASVTVVRLSSFVSVLRRLFRDIADLKPSSTAWSIFNPTSSDEDRDSFKWVRLLFRDTAIDRMFNIWHLSIMYTLCTIQTHCTTSPLLLTFLFISVLCYLPVGPTSKHSHAVFQAD